MYRGFLFEDVIKWMRRLEKHPRNRRYKSTWFIIVKRQFDLLTSYVTKKSSTILLSYRLIQMK